MRRPSFLALALSFLGSALANAADPPSDLAAIRQRGTLRILIDPGGFDPVLRLFFRTPSGFDGVEYAILESFTKPLGLKTEVVIAPAFDELIPWLVAGKGDVISDSMSITQERKKIVDFTESYFPIRRMVLVRKGSGVHSVKDLAGLRTEAQAGGTTAAAARKIPGVKLIIGEQRTEYLPDLETSRIDFLILDSPMALAYLQKSKNVEHAFTFGERADLDYGFATRLGSDLGTALTSHIRKLKERGVYYSLLERFLGSNAVAMIRKTEK